jgi:hypothetical protein
MSFHNIDDAMESHEQDGVFDAPRNRYYHPNIPSTQEEERCKQPMLAIPTCALLDGEDRRVYFLACETAVRLDPDLSFSKHKFDSHMQKTVKHREDEAAWVAKGGYLKEKNIYKVISRRYGEGFVEMVCHRISYLPGLRIVRVY